METEKDKKSQYIDNKNILCAVKSQQIFYSDALPSNKIRTFYRRTELVNGKVLWEKPSQYGTFTFVRDSMFEELESLFCGLH